MTSDKLWSEFVKRNPKFTTQGGNFTANGLRKFFDTAYREGFKQGQKAAPPSNPYNEIFGEIFGK
jgi:hypothetical protein